MQGMAASVQGAAKQLMDLTVGSVLRAMLEANASLALWMQWLIVQVLSATRLATSTGGDCDSFGADFGFVRLAAVAATGQATFARFTPSVAAFVPVGANIATTSNTQSFTVTADSTNTAFSPTTGGYTLPAGVVSFTVPIVAVVAGSAGNIQPSAISLMSSALAGVDTVTNGLALTGGADAESDSAFKARFSNYLASLSRATNLAIGATVMGIQQGLSYTINENVDQTGAMQMGHFVLTIDDGTGHPPASLIQTVQQAVDAVRPAGSSFAVQAPVVAAAHVAFSISTAPGVSHEVVVGSVATAVEAYIAGLGIGMTLNYTRLAQLAYAASASVTNVSSLLLNGGSADLVPPLFGVIRTGTVTVA